MTGIVEETGVGAAAEDWEDLYVAHFVETVRLAGLLVGDFHLGEDVAQEALARLLVVRHRVADPVAYLRRTTVNMSRSLVRRAVVRRRHVDDGRFTVAGPEERTEILAARVALTRGLQQLSVRQREAIVLRFYGQMSEAEIAAAMKVSTGSVKTHLHRGLKALGPILEEFR